MCSSLPAAQLRDAWSHRAPLASGGSSLSTDSVVATARSPPSCSPQEDEGLGTKLTLGPEKADQVGGVGVRGAQRLTRRWPGRALSRVWQRPGLPCSSSSLPTLKACGRRGGQGHPAPLDPTVQQNERRRPPFSAGMKPPGNP